MDIFSSLANREELKSPLDELRMQEKAQIPPKDKQD